MTNRFALPLTQAVIGDTMGLTNVAVAMESLVGAGIFLNDVDKNLIDDCAP